ncbi:MAG: hypothetical protein ACOZQL_00640 [Myxococcota bacterium]
MHSLLKSFVVASVVLSSLAFAQPQGEVVIRSRDGKTRMGRILSETSKGYLLAGPDGTEVVEFASIVDIRQLAPTATASAASVAPVAPAPATPPGPVAPAAKGSSKQKAAPAPVVAEAPPPPPPAPEPVLESAPPPPERPAQPPVSEVVAQGDVETKSPREGFHFGLGAGAFILPFGPMAQLQAHFEFNYGRPVYRINANLGALALYSSGLVTLSVDNLFQYNIGDVYAFGVGLQVGVVIGAAAFLQLAPVIQPVILKFGDRGQHQLSLTGSISLLSTVASGSSYSVSFAGVPQVYLGYSYLF